jgi:HlyD family secretion protein
MDKSLKIAIEALLVLAIGFSVWFFFFKKGTEQSLNMQTKVVDYGDILTSVTATGTVKPLLTVNIGTQVSGVISKIYVDYSDHVKKGQKLAELDRSTLQASYISSKASYESAQNELNYQRSNFNRNKQLYSSQSVSKTDYETAEYQYHKAEDSYTVSKQDLKKAETNLGYATIYSPIDGVVLSRAVDEGQTVAASFSTPTMFTVAKDLTKMQVIANVDEADIGNVKIGQSVMFTVDAFPDDKFHGKVIMVRLEATTTSNVVTYEVVIDAPNPTLKLLPGLTANINIYTKERRNVLLIPSKALRVHLTDEMSAMLEKKSGLKVETLSDSPKTANKESAVNKNASNALEGETSQKSVWLKKADGNITQRKITIGATDGVSTEVISGLQKGDVVLTDLTLSETKADKESASDSSKSSSPFMPKRQSKSTKK